MIGINDVCNMCIIKCITTQYLNGIVLLNGDNSGHNEKKNIVDIVCLKTLNGF